MCEFNWKSEKSLFPFSPFLDVLDIFRIFVKFEMNLHTENFQYYFQIFQPISKNF